MIAHSRNPGAGQLMPSNGCFSRRPRLMASKKIDRVDFADFIEESADF